MDKNREITIHSISEYMEYLESIKRIDVRNSALASFTFFRGQANSKWKIAPSLYRQGLFNSERAMITEIMHTCPDEFAGSRFETLTKLQHYGMPTRLLDTTTNPLVALYFACASIQQMNADGAVYTFHNLPVSWSNDPLVEITMDYVFEYSSTQVNLDQMLQCIKDKYKYSQGRLIPNDVQTLLTYLMIPAYAVMPARANPRLIAQDGAFFLFGMGIQSKHLSSNPGTLDRVLYSFESSNIEGPQKICSELDKLIIPSSQKADILRQLDYLSINEQTLFPDLSHQIEHVVKIANRQRKSNV